MGGLRATTRIAPVGEAQVDLKGESLARGSPWRIKAIQIVDSE